MLIVLALMLSMTAPVAPASHDRAYWQSIKTHNFDVPAGASAPALATELSALLGSPDPTLRDDLASAILSEWIVRKRVLTPADMRPLLATWTTNLQRGVGAAGDRTVLLRSFSALALSAVAERDNADPFLTPGEHAALLDAALSYLGAERDLRGFDERLGWIHAAAHTANVIKFLARSPYLTVPQQRAILDAVAATMRSASVVFTFGEDERWARAIASILIRTDLDLAGFRDWVSRLAGPPDAKVTVALLRSRQNVTNLLSKLGVLLARQPSLPAGVAAARDIVLVAAKF